MGFSAIDYIVLLLYLVGITVFGMRFRRSQRTVKDYFIGSKNTSWVVISLSIVATETSTLTLIGVPALAYTLYARPEQGGSLTYLQVVFGYIIARFIISLLFIPAYFKGELLTAYELLKQRFGPQTKNFAASLFLVMRALAEGVRVYAASLVLSAVLSASLPKQTDSWLWSSAQSHLWLISIFIVGLLTLVYTFEGGIAAVIWTDLIQLVIYIAGSLLAGYMLLRLIPGGWDTVVAAGQEANKFQVFSFAWDFNVPFTFWAGVLGGTCLTMASHGTDQLLVQRLLTCRDQRDSQKALVLSGFVVLFQFALFLLIGVMLFAYAKYYPLNPQSPSNDDVFPLFIVERLPHVVKGLVIAAIFAAAMSNLSGSLNSLASTTVIDFYKPLAGRDKSDESLLRLSRWFTAAWGIVLIAIAVLASGWGSVFTAGLTIASLVYGPMLGAFLLGVMSRRANQTGVMAGMAVSLVFMLLVKIYTSVAWTWYVLMGTLVCLAVGYAVSLFGKRSVAAVEKATGIIALAVTTSLLAPPLLAQRKPAADHAPQLTQAAPEAVGMSGERLARIDEAVRASIERKETPGAVVLVARRGRVVYRKAFGDRAVEPQREAMTVDTIFDLASLTKVVATTTAIMILVERGQLSLADPVSLYIPEFAQNGKDRVTIEQLMTHRAGLPPDNEIADYVGVTVKPLEEIYKLRPSYEPGTRFSYSDVGFIVAAEVVRRVSGKRIDEFARENIFAPLGMTQTTYFPFGPESPRPPAVAARIAPTEMRQGRWMRGEVHDPRSYEMGGVAGHAGLFSTADDLAVFCQMIMNKGEINGVRVLAPYTVERMLDAHTLPTSQMRGIGWDINTNYSSNRGDLFPVGTFGHTGFTGTSLWLDPASETFVIILTNRVHPTGHGDVTRLRSFVASIVAASITAPPYAPVFDGLGSPVSVIEAPRAAVNRSGPPAGPLRPVLTGIDVLSRDGFKALEGRRVGLITNHAGLDREGRSTIDRLAAAPGVKLVALFSPEHGLRGVEDANVKSERDEKTGLPVYSLYDSATRRPSAEMLNGIDTLVFDIQDVGVRFYTYTTTMLYTMEEAARHKIKFVVLDRPNPINGYDIEGPVNDADLLSFTSPHTIPVRHGMTLGELAMLFNSERKVGADLTVIKMEGWRRADFFDATSLVWVNPSPNMRSLTEALLYPGIGLLETTNISVGRGTDTPFEVLGAPWIEPRQLSDALNRAGLAGVRFVPVRFTPKSSKFAGESCGGVNLVLTDRASFRPVTVGLEIAYQLNRLYSGTWKIDDSLRLLANRATLAALKEGKSPAELVRVYQDGLAEFARTRQKYLLY